MEGVWVRSDYINDLIKTRSPYLSRSGLRDVASIMIKMPDGKSDSVNVGYSLNNHEGAEFVMYFKTRQLPTSLKLSLPDYDIISNFYELGYSVRERDTALILYHYNKTNQVIDKTVYTKVADKATDKNDAGWGITYITHKKLIVGKYLMSDSKGHRSIVEFADNNQVHGFLDFKTYYVNADFEAGPENNLDEIDFNINTKKQKGFTFKFSAGTLNLYDTKENADSTLLLIGKLRYKLVRQK